MNSNHINKRDGKKNCREQMGDWYVAILKVTKLGALYVAKQISGWGNQPEW